MCAQRILLKLSPFSALGPGRLGAREGTILSPPDGTGWTGWWPCRAVPGPGRALRGGLGVQPPALGSAGCSSWRPAPAPGPSPSPGHGGTLGTGVALLGALRRPLFIFFFTCFFLFSPPARFAAHTSVGACPRPYQATVLSPPSDMPCGVQPPPHLAKPRRGTKRLRGGLWGKGTRGHPDTSLKSGQGVSDLEASSKRGSHNPDSPAFVFSASVIPKSIQQRWKAGWAVGDGGRSWHRPPRVSLSLPSCSDRSIWPCISISL